MPTPTQLNQFAAFLDGLPRTPVRVESQDDARQPGRTGYRISGPTAASVQEQINTLIADMEEAGGGRADFTPPRPIEGGGYGSLGQIVLVHP